MSLSAATVHEALHESAQTFGNTRGLRYYHTRDSSEYRGFAELDRRARAVASRLTAAGFGPGDLAIIGLARGLECVEAIYGALYAGLAFAPAPVAGYGSADMMAHRVAGIARSADARVLITSPSDYAALGGSLPGVELSTLMIDEMVAEGGPDSWMPPQVDGDSMALLLFTSGSTGDPKGVIGTHRMIMSSVADFSRLFGYSSESVMLGWAPLHHAMGIFTQVFIPISLGAEGVILATSQFQKRPAVWLQLMSKHRATSSSGGNFAFTLATQFATDELVAELDLSSVDTLFSGSEPVRAATVQAFVERFAPAGLKASSVSPLMAATEALVISAKPAGSEVVIRTFDAASRETGLLRPSTGDGGVEMVSCGRPSETTSVVIIDPQTLQPVEGGTIGELWVAGPGVSPGYYRRPDATAETFGHSVPGFEGSYMRTGDLAAIVDGELFITGRLKDMINIRGRNIYPQDLEAMAVTVSEAVGISAAFELEGHPSAIGIISEVDEESREVAGLSYAELTAQLQKELIAYFSLPSLAVGLVPLGQLPRTGAGKVTRRPVRVALESGGLPLVHATGFAAAAPPPVS